MYRLSIAKRRWARASQDGQIPEARLVEIGPVQFGARNARNGFPCSPQHFHGTLLEQLFGAEEFDWAFMVVRHPVGRMVSQYRYEVHRRRQPLPAPPFFRWLRETILARRDNPYVRDNHLRPQHEFEEGVRNLVLWYQANRGWTREIETDPGRSPVVVE